MKRFIAILIIFIVLFFPILLMADNIDSTYKYSWGENVGWMNWKPSYGGTDCGVTVYNKCLTGYIWTENAGWIKVGDTSCAGGNCCQTGTTKGYENDANSTDNDGDGVADDWGVNNDGLGNLSGYAWGENAGWINFSSAYHQVVINSSGEFTGYAWGENIGWINMNCSNTLYCGTVDFKVKTSWAPPAGGGVPSAFMPLQPPVGDFRILINNGAEYTDNLIVNLTLFGGPDTARMAISNFLDFRDTGQELYKMTKEWNLCQGKEVCREGEYTVYAKFFAPWGTASKVVSDSIIYKITPAERLMVEILTKMIEILKQLIQLYAQLIQMLKS